MRTTGVPGCYRLVGYDAPPEPTFDGMVHNADQLLQPGDRCVCLPVSEDGQIEFQQGMSLATMLTTLEKMVRILMMEVFKWSVMKML